MTTPTIEIDDTRKKLGEGRHEGIGFSLLKKMGDNLFKMVMPLSPCKDYMNDVIYSELSGKPFGAYGLSTKKEGIIGDNAYVAFSDCPSSGSVPAADFIKKKGGLVPKDMTNMLAIMHEIETKLGLKDKTELQVVENNLIFAKIAKEWASSSWAISLWGTLIRNAIFADGVGSFEEQLKKTQDDEDSTRLKHVFAVINAWAEKGFPKQDVSGHFSHHYGIMSHKL